MWIFVFWTPCMAKIAFYWLGLSIYEKGSQNAPHQKGKFFQKTQYFDQAFRKFTSGAPFKVRVSYYIGITQMIKFFTRFGCAVYS